MIQAFLGIIWEVCVSFGLLSNRIAVDIFASDFKQQFCNSNSKYSERLKTLTIGKVERLAENRFIFN